METKQPNGIQTNTKPKIGCTHNRNNNKIFYRNISRRSFACSQFLNEES